MKGERRSGGVEEWRSGGAEEWRSGGWKDRGGKRGEKTKRRGRGEKGVKEVAVPFSLGFVRPQCLLE